MTDVDGNEELIQIAERQLADAEEAYRLDPSDANQRRIMRAWSAVRRARESRERGRDESGPADPDEQLDALPDRSTTDGRA
jgi:hypothetical protein